jgi:hypothetical protein
MRTSRRRGSAASQKRLATRRANQARLAQEATTWPEDKLVQIVRATNRDFPSDYERAALNEQTRRRNLSYRAAHPLPAPTAAPPSNFERAVDGIVTLPALSSRYPSSTARSIQALPFLAKILLVPLTLFTFVPRLMFLALVYWGGLLVWKVVQSLRRRTSQSQGPASRVP